jgi:hypothetical protein
MLFYEVKIYKIYPYLFIYILLSRYEVTINHSNCVDFFLYYSITNLNYF